MHVPFQWTNLTLGVNSNDRGMFWKSIYGGFQTSADRSDGIGEGVFKKWAFSSPRSNLYKILKLYFQISFILIVYAYFLIFLHFSYIFIIFHYFSKLDTFPKFEMKKRTSISKLSDVLRKCLHWPHSKKIFMECRWVETGNRCGYK